MRTEARGTVAVAPPPARRRVPVGRYVLFFGLVVAGLGWDLASKSVVFSDLGYPAGRGGAQVPGEHQHFAAPPLVEGETRPYVQGWMTFRLYTSLNEGALWGMGQGLTRFFAGLSVVAVLFVFYWLFIHGAARSWWLTTALGLIMAGTLGNLYDRLGLHGLDWPQSGEPIYAVRDFLLFTFGGWPWPVFNFADVFLVTGATMLVAQSLLMSADGTEREGVGEGERGGVGERVTG